MVGNLLNRPNALARPLVEIRYPSASKLLKVILDKQYQSVIMCLQVRHDPFVPASPCSTTRRSFQILQYPCVYPITLLQREPAKQLPFSVHSSKFRILQVLCLPLLRKVPGCVPTIPLSALDAQNSPLYSTPFVSNSCEPFCSLLHSGESQLFSFQALPHSLRKTPGGGVSPQLSQVATICFFSSPAQQ